MIKAILFDLGGVVYKHPKNIIPHVLSKVYRISLNRAIRGYSVYRKAYFTNDITTEELITNLNQVFGCKKSIPEIKKLWLKYYSVFAIADNRMLSLIIRLRKNYRVYLFSNTTPMSHLHNKKTGIYNHFDKLFLTFEMRMGKPDVSSFKFVLNSLKLKARECIFVDDKDNNIAAAKKLGIKAILFDILKDDPEDLKAQLKNFGVKS